jgi:hypothetical protein
MILSFRENPDEQANLFAILRGLCIFIRDNALICTSRRSFMRERNNRLAVVKELIKNNRIDNQDTLLDMLKHEGYNVTHSDSQQRLEDAEGR